MERALGKILLPILPDTINLEKTQFHEEDLYNAPRTLISQAAQHITWGFKRAKLELYQQAARAIELEQTLPANRRIL